MSGCTGSPVEQIDAVDAFARTLYLRTKQTSSPTDDAVAAAVRQLHLALRHLRVEAADPDSLLNGPDAPVYSRQLRTAVEDSSLALSQLDSTLDKYEGGGGSVAAERAQRLAALQNKLAGQTTDIELLLDAVQLRNPLSQPRAVINGSQTGLEAIKDKVDVIANRLFSHRDSSFSNDEDSLWQEFRSELEKEGFSPQVLRKHKDILRAYIRELESASVRNGGAPPTVRGLLEHEAATPKELMAFENEKCFPSMKEERRMPDSAPMPSQQVGAYVPRRSTSSDDSGSDGGDALAMICTRDLIAMDHLAANMASMHLQPPNQHYSISPAYSNQRYLPSNVAGALPSSEGELVVGSPNSQALSASPRSVPPLPPYSSPGVPPAYSSPQMITRLAPDPWGNEIPMDAQWTKIKRTLVSSEVLSRAGLRFEARPDYVAVLGLLPREQIRDLARQSADLRAARARRQTSSQRQDKYGHDRMDSKSSRDEEDEDSELWDDSDTTSFEDDKTTEKGTKSYPYIVSPPEKEKVSPSSTVQPKSILKNKNENHVRFGPDPYEVDSRSPARSDRSDRRGERAPPPRRHRDHRDGDRDRGEPRSSGERERERERHRGGDDNYHRRQHHRDRGDRRGDKSSKKKWGGTLGAVGIGGAAVSLLSVLAEAASGMA